MSKFLITVWPFDGHIFPLIAVAHALKVRGHQVAFYTGSTQKVTVEREGFIYFPFRKIDERRLDRLLFESNADSTRRRPLQLQVLLRKWMLDTLPAQIDDLSLIIEQWQPDVVIAETAMMGPMLVLYETRHIPVAIFSTLIACLLPGADTPPFGLGLPHTRNWRSQLLALSVRLATHLLGIGFRRTANKLRATYDLPPLQLSVTEFAGKMPLYLVPSLPVFDYERQDLPLSVHYVGPCVWNKPDHQLPPSWLTQLCDKRPLIHVTEGTVHVQKPHLLQTAAQALADLNLHVVMTTGNNRDPAKLDLPLRSNIHVERWIAHSDLLPLTDLIVTTGGAGTVMAALTAGVPLVVVPTEWDKLENAQRVAEAGVGVRLPLRCCTPRNLRAAVEEVLTEPTFRQNAQRLATIMRSVNGPQRASELLERLVV